MKIERFNSNPRPVNSEIIEETVRRPTIRLARTRYRQRRSVRRSCRSSRRLLLTHLVLCLLQKIAELFLGHPRRGHFLAERPEGFIDRGPLQPRRTSPVLETV